MVGGSQQVLQVDVVADVAKVQVREVVHLVVEALCQLVVLLHLRIGLRYVAHWLQVAAILDCCLVVKSACALRFFLRVWPVNHLNSWLGA